MSENLIPRQPKRKRQPTAACMREQLVLAANEIISLRQRLAAYSDPDAPYRVTTLRVGSNPAAPAGPKPTPPANPPRRRWWHWRTA